MIIMRRAVGAAFFKKNVVFDIYLDHRATADAALLIIGLTATGYLWSVLGGIGFSIWTLLFLMINSLMLWIVRAGVCLLVGKVLYKTNSSMPTIMRLQGFSYLPLVLTFLPASIGRIGIIWFLALMVFATAEAMEVVWWQSAITVGTSVVGLLIIGPLFWGGYRLF